MRSKLFEVPLYSTRLYVVVGKTTGEELYRHVLKKFSASIPKLKTEVSGCNGSCNAKGELIVIYLETLRGREAKGVLAHECFHAVAENMRYSGVGFSASSEESWAYLLDWMVKTILEWGGT